MLCHSVWPESCSFFFIDAESDIFKERNWISHLSGWNIIYSGFFRFETSVYKKIYFQELLDQKKKSAPSAVLDELLLRRCKLLQDHFRLAACEERPVMSVADINTRGPHPLEIRISFWKLMWQM